MKIRKIPSKEWTSYSVPEAIKYFKKQKPDTYDGATEGISDAYVIDLETASTSTLHFDNESECRKFESEIRFIVSKFKERHFIRETTSIRIWKSDLERIKHLRELYPSYAAVINDIFNEFFYKE